MATVLVVAKTKALSETVGTEYLYHLNPPEHDPTNHKTLSRPNSRGSRRNGHAVRACAQQAPKHTCNATARQGTCVSPC